MRDDHETAAAPPTVDETSFRRAMAQFPAGVTIVAADDGAQAHGLTVSSFTSVSLAPPQCLVCVNLESPLLPILRRAQRFSVHVLAAEQAALAETFAAGAPQDRLAALIRRNAAPPRLADYAVRFELALAAEHAAGDHAILVGDVLTLDPPADRFAADPRTPLTWWRSALGSLVPTR